MKAMYQLRFEELLAEFDQYVLERPDFAQRIPPGAQIVFVDETDVGFSRWSVQTFGKPSPVDGETDRSIVYIEVGKLAPRRSRLQTPRLIPRAPAYATT
jgi:hypothetical protein